MLPLIPLAAIVSAALAGGAGIAKGVDAHGKHKKAQNIMREAESMIESAQNSLRESVNRSDEALSNLGSRKLKVLDGSMDRFIFVFEMIHNIELKDSSGLDELRKYRIDKQEVHELKSMSLLGDCDCDTEWNCCTECGTGISWWWCIGCWWRRHGTGGGCFGWTCRGTGSSCFGLCRR